MSQVVTYAVGEGIAVEFEIDPVEGFVPAGVADIAGQVREAIEPAVRTAQAVLDRMRAISPDQVQVTFGVKVTGTANWLVAKAATEGNFQVTLTWSPGQSSAMGDGATAGAE